MSRPRKLTPIKRLERYVSAIFKLGRTEGMAKNAKKRITAAELRMDAIEAELGKIGHGLHDIWDNAAQVSETLDAQAHALDETRHSALGQIEEALGTALDEVRALAARLEQLETTSHAASTAMTAEFQANRAEMLRSMRAETSLLARVFSDLSRRVDGAALPDDQTVPVPASAPQPGAPNLPSTDGFDLFKDSFYHRLENRYRGSVAEITRRLTIYLPDVEAAWMRTGHKPAMDIGCGRGEWLGLLQGAGITAFGVDTNAVQIEAAREAGLDVRLGDALAALAGMQDNSLSLISAHHLVEHLPFDAVAWITREAMRVLAPGGVLLYETPHTRNVLVGATTFHTDPTHLKPMPEQVLSVLFDTAGFDPVEIRALNPHDRFAEFVAKADFNDELAFLMFGPQDLAVLGTKPETAQQGVSASVSAAPAKAAKPAKPATTKPAQTKTPTAQKPTAKTPKTKPSQAKTAPTNKD